MRLILVQEFDDNVKDVVLYSSNNLSYTVEFTDVTTIS